MAAVAPLVIALPARLIGKNAASKTCATARRNLAVAAAAQSNPKGHDARSSPAEPAATAGPFPMRPSAGSLLNLRVKSPWNNSPQMCVPG